MWQALQSFRKAHPQTKLFIFMLILYMGAIIWTTIQAYARLEYSRTAIGKPIVIKIESSDDS